MKQGETLDFSSNPGNGIAAEDAIDLLSRRVRNVVSIQIRNLTPFPARDAFASALTQPSEQPQFTAEGRLSDDLDVTIGRKRGRKVSSGSISTLKSLKSDGGLERHEQRKRAVSKVTFSGEDTIGPNSASGPSRRPAASGSGPTIRPIRARTTSIQSTTSSHFSGHSLRGYQSSASSGAFLSLVSDNSQKGLEKVVKSRLIETFITLKIHPRVSASSLPASPGLSGLSNPPPPSPVSDSASGREHIARGRHKSCPSTSSTKSRSSAGQGAGKQTSNAIPENPLASPSRFKGFSALHDSSSSVDVSSSSYSFPVSEEPASILEVPDYISSIHRPSTNPVFSVDPARGKDFPEWADLTSDSITITLWGKTNSDEGREEDVKGKGKEKAPAGPEEEWKTLQEWNVDMSDLRLLPEHLASRKSQLPFNTLLITLSSSGQTYFVPSHMSSQLRSRSPSASPSRTGYSSDPEVDARRVKNAGDLILPASQSTPDAGSGRRAGVQKVSSKRRGATAFTASWQDLVKLATLQTCIIDIQESLGEAVQDMDKLIVGDELGLLRREASERECWVNQLRQGRAQLGSTTDELRNRINARRKNLRRRTEILAEAKSFHEESDLPYEKELENQTTHERERLSSLQSRFAPVRSTLITTLESIFPIELYSPPDLLFTILDVPLPIPSSSTDPAPPLSLPSHKEVNEDSVATALGYAAQLVQLLAAYLGKRLVYPITCVGSRSLIKDGISAMVGPRMFPLFSKGVDTYRFEYGVFLLNKNIELLMSDRDLKALDMRHTLPNLKNLLLTLTDGEGAKLAISSSANSPSLCAMRSPPRIGSPVSLDHLTESESSESSSFQVDGDQTASGRTTPTAPTTPSEPGTLSRMSKPFLAFSSFSLLRSRQSTVESVASAVKSSPALPETVSASGEARNASENHLANGNAEDEDDRRTLRGVHLNGGGGSEAKAITNGHHHAAQENTPTLEKNGGPGHGPAVAATTFAHVN